MLEDYDQIIGKQLKSIRDERGYTLAEVSSNTNVNVSTLGNYEQGIRSIPVPKLRTLLDFYKYDFNRFMTEVFQLCEHSNAYDIRKQFNQLYDLLNDRTKNIATDGVVIDQTNRTIILFALESVIDLLNKIERG